MRKRSLKLLGVAAAVAAATALTASAALANTGHVWEVNGVKLANGQSQTIGCSLEAGTVLTIKGIVLGTIEVHLTVHKVECEESTINQDIVGVNGIATDSGKWKLSEITVDKPVGCGITQPITTNQIQSEVVTKEHGTGLFDTTKPTSGTTFAHITLTGCAAAETYPLKGSVCAELNKIGTLAVNQRKTFNETADKACAPDGLTLGGQPAILRGELTEFLTGANTGKTWGVTAF